MPALEPTSDAELAKCLIEAAQAGRSIRLGDTITTREMTRVLQYEPRDLTISVEAGVRYAELKRLLAADGLMIPLDPPWSDTATVAGVISANRSGSRRRLYGTARDLVIGMRFATLEGALVDTGGMVVKNVAGLDMAKMLIGAFGTLAVIASVNFKLIPLPKHSRTIVFEFKTSREAFVLRNRVLKSILPVAALDVLNPAAAVRCGHEGWVVALRAVNAVERYPVEFPGGRDVNCEPFWASIQEFTPRYLEDHPSAVVTRYSTTHTAMPDLMEACGGVSLARAGNGVVYCHDGKVVETAKRVVEHGPPGIERWPSPGGDLQLMQRVKEMFDPQGLLNPGALYGRI